MDSNNNANALPPTGSGFVFTDLVTTSVSADGRSGAGTTSAFSFKLDPATLKDSGMLVYDEDGSPNARILFCVRFGLLAAAPPLAAAASRRTNNNHYGEEDNNIVVVNLRQLAVSIRLVLQASFSLPVIEVPSTTAGGGGAADDNTRGKSTVYRVDMSKTALGVKETKNEPPPPPKTVEEEEEEDLVPRLASSSTAGEAIQKSTTFNFIVIATSVVVAIWL